MSIHCKFHFFLVKIMFMGMWSLFLLLMFFIQPFLFEEGVLPIVKIQMD